MSVRVLGWVLGLSVFVLLAAPFAHDLWSRYVYVKELYQLSDPVARARLLDRYGHIGGFAADVATRCREIHGFDQPDCMPPALQRQ
jgi:hypothetical protein